MLTIYIQKVKLRFVFTYFVGYNFLMSIESRRYILLFILIAPLIYLYGFHHQMVQNQAFYNFADQHLYCKIPHFHNVVSNIVFTIFSGYGIFLYFKEKEKFTISWLVFLLGVFFVAPGSAYFHWNPNDATLVWDRLPMTVGFMGLTSVALVEVFKIKKEGLLLSLLVALGIYSVIHWVVFNDLRVYTWVQVAPIVGLLYISMTIPSKVLKTRYLLIAVAFYLLAKASETYDQQVLDFIGYNGHSLKHILAGFSTLSLIWMRKD